MTVNRERRKALRDIIEQLEELKDSLEGLQTEEEEYRDNIPENLQGGGRCERADEAVNSMSDAVGYLEDVISNIEAAVE